MSAAAVGGAGTAGSVGGHKRPRTEINAIGNKYKRAEVLSKLRVAKKKDRKARQETRRMMREELGDAAPPKEEPRTQDNTREVDETVVLPDDEEVLGDEADDEFAPYYRFERGTKIMITTQPSPSGKIYRMVAELMAVLPNSYFYKRKKYRLKKIVEWANEAKFTHILVLSEKAKATNGLIVIHLPFGPTAAFRLTSQRLSSEIEGHGRMTSHTPEVILNNFITRVGRRVGRFVGSLFPQKAEFVGRRVCTFHNQRDFIFFRQHRYIFEQVEDEKAPKGKDGKPGTRLRVRLQELGPRFTLKLKWLMAGTFDTAYGEYEWFYKRHQMESSRRRFML